MEDNRKGPGIFYAVVGVATLVVAIVGATFAYFSATAENNSSITGTTAEGGKLTLTVTRVAPSTTPGNLVPLNVHPGDGTSDTGTSQLSDALSNSCTDTNQNTVCHVYSIKIDNTGATAVNVKGQLNLTSSATGMRWKLLTNATTDNGDNTLRGVGTAYDIVASENLAATNGTHTYYVLVWLEEAGASQDTPDANKDFTGTVTFNAVDATGASTGGLTATFTSAG